MMRGTGIEVTLRKAVIADCKALNQLWDEVFESFGLGENAFEQLFYDLRITTLVSVEHGRIQGAILYIYHGEYCDILALLVHPTLHRQGMGRRLLESCLEGIQSQGAQIVRLHTAETNRIARTFFERLGFIVTNKAERYPNGEVAIRYERRITTRS